MLVDVDLNMRIPKGYCGLVTGRSSVALKGIHTHVGIVDNDYRGLVCIALTNIGCYPQFDIREGDRIAQTSLVKYDKARWNEVKSFESLNYGPNVRSGGFGSTGI